MFRWTESGKTLEKVSNVSYDSLLILLCKIRYRCVSRTDLPITGRRLRPGTSDFQALVCKNVDFCTFKVSGPLNVNSRLGLSRYRAQLTGPDARLSPHGYRQLLLLMDSTSLKAVKKEGLLKDQGSQRAVCRFTRVD